MAEDFAKVGSAGALICVANTELIMQHEIVEKESCCVSGRRVELTTSQNANFKLIRHQWQTFNQELRSLKISLGSSWTKYGITTRANGRLFYMTAIPSKDRMDDFESEVITGGRFLCVTHVGSIDLITSSINTIYKEILPAGNQVICDTRRVVHYEHYDSRFHWNRQDSEIDIYVPIHGDA